MAADTRAQAAPDLPAAVSGLGLHLTGETQDGVLIAAAPGCRNPVRLAVQDFDGQNDTAVSALRASGTQVLTVYLGQVTASRWLIPMVGRWATASLRHSIGLREAAVPRDIVLISLPKDCPALAHRDWTALSPW